MINGRVDVEFYKIIIGGYNMTQVNGSTNYGSPVHSDNPKEVAYVTMGSDGQGNGRVTPVVTSHMTGNSNNGVEGGINNKGEGTHGPRFNN